MYISAVKKTLRSSLVHPSSATLRPLQLPGGARYASMPVAEAPFLRLSHALTAAKVEHRFWASTRMLKKD
jgi:hypothetical protein